MATPAYAFTREFARTNSVVFLSDNLRNALREIIREYGLNPNNLMQDWTLMEVGIRTWLHSGHLESIVIEFFKPGASTASARWDVPIGYDGSGVVDDMWLDKDYLRQLIAKSKRPTTDCVYRIILVTSPGKPWVDGFTSCTFLSTGSLAARHAGTVIATGYMTAGVTYWR